MKIVLPQLTGIINTKVVVIEPPPDQLNHGIEPVPEFYTRMAFQDWQLNKIEEYFISEVLPTGYVFLSPFEKITNVSEFINASLAALKANEGKIIYLPYLQRLNDLKIILSNSYNDF